jgi:hypothetical protein
MKQLLAIFFAFLISSQLTNAQNSRKLESFKEKVLPEYSTYFNQAELAENRQLNLSAVDKYILLPADRKKEIMVNISKAWQDSLVLVHYGSKRELWGWSAETGNAILLDKWDLNAPLFVKPQIANPQYTVSHPWFFYIGGQLGGDLQGSINLSLNTRLGFFLLKNRWDMATTFSTGLTGNLESESSPANWSNLGLMSRVHFPIRKIGLSPNIGGEITMSPNGGSNTVNWAAVLGISWYVGFGSLDIGVSIGDQISTMGGFTFFPKGKNNKPK